MTNLHIIVSGANDVTRSRAVNALEQAGVVPAKAWLDPRTAADVHAAQDNPGDAAGQARAFEAGARQGLGIALDEANRPGATMDDLRRVLPKVAANPSDYVSAPHPTRNPAGCVVGVLIAAPSAALAAWMIHLGGWWWALAVSATLLALFGIMGIAVSTRKKSRSRRSPRGI